MLHLSDASYRKNTGQTGDWPERHAGSMASINFEMTGRILQGRIQDLHWGGAAGPGGVILAIEGATLP